MKPATAVAITQAETPVMVSALHPHTNMHMYQCHLSPLMSQPSPPLPHPLPPDSGGDMPEKWQGSDALHPPSPGGSTLLFYVVGHDRCLCLCNGHSSGRLHLHSCGDLLLEWNIGTSCACSLSQSSSLHMKLYIARFNSTKAREGPDDLEIAQYDIIYE